MHEAKQEYSYTWAMDSAVKHQLQAEVATSRFLTAAACNLGSWVNIKTLQLQSGIKIFSWWIREQTWDK